MEGRAWGLRPEFFSDPPRFHGIYIRLNFTLYGTPAMR